MMYSTCLFCHTDLGANDDVEACPVGRRLAFDPAKGRLWVVCTFCGRWNLTPLEERWEAVERCEQLYRDTWQRYSVENIRAREDALASRTHPHRPRALPRDRLVALRRAAAAPPAR